jgi:nitrite reductase (NADH) large subunit
MNMVSEKKYTYKGTVSPFTLKVMGIDLTSMGLIAAEGNKQEEIKKIDSQMGIYRKVVLEQGKIVGGIFLGDSKGVGAIKRLMDLGIDVTRYKNSLLQDDFDFREIQK